MRKTMPFTTAGFRALAADQTIERRRMAYFALREAEQQRSIAAWKEQYNRVMHGVCVRTVSWKIRLPSLLQQPRNWDVEIAAGALSNAQEELQRQEDAGFALAVGNPKEE